MVNWKTHNGREIKHGLSKRDSKVFEKSFTMELKDYNNTHNLVLYGFQTNVSLHEFNQTVRTLQYIGY